MRGMDSFSRSRTGRRSACRPVALLALALLFKATEGSSPSPEAVQTEAELRAAVLGGSADITINSTLITLTGFISPETAWSQALFPPIKDTNLTVRCGIKGKCELRVAPEVPARVFRVQKGGLLRAEGLILSGGSADIGGAILIEEGGRAEFENSDFLLNNATSSTQARGGAVFVDGGTARFDKVTFDSNGFFPADGKEMYGGAVFIQTVEGQGSQPGRPKLHMECYSCLFRNNSASHGGAVALSGISTIQIADSAFEANSVSEAGGALWSGPSINKTLSRFWRRTVGNDVNSSRSFFVKNSAGAQGGAVYFEGLNNWRFSRCHFNFNNAGNRVVPRLSHGGAIRATGGRDSRLYGSFDGCTFVNNSAYNGGSMAVSTLLEGHLSLSNCSFTGDHAHVSGGSVWLYYVTKQASFDNCGFAQSSSLNGGAIWANITSLLLQRSQFMTNEAFEGGALYAAGNSRITMDVCTLSVNSAQRSGGALKITDLAYVTATKSGFWQNKPPSTSGSGDKITLQGGAVAITGRAEAHVSTFLDCNFVANLAGEGGAVMAMSVTKFIGCKFTENTAEKGGAIRALNAPDLSAIACTFSNNIAVRTGGGVDLESSTASLKICSFEMNRARDGNQTTNELGGALHISGAMEDLAVKLQECNFKDNHATYGGAIFLGNGASMRMDKGKFVANTADKMGGAVRIGALPEVAGSGQDTTSAEGEFAGVVFANHSATNGAGAIDVWSSRALLSRCDFEGNSASASSPLAATMSGLQEQWGGAVRVQGRKSEVDFDACSFKHNTAPYGGAIYAGLGSGILLTACTFDSNTARYGGAVRLETSAEALASECTFSGQRVFQGGALSCEGPSSLFASTAHAWVRRSTFSENLAEASGGAIDNKGCSMFLNSNTFTKNRVMGVYGQGGGAFAIHSATSEESEHAKGQLTFDDDEFDLNEAHTGGTGSITGVAEVSFYQSRIYNSTAAGSGGSIFASGPDVQLNFVEAKIEGSSAGGFGGGLVLDRGGKLFMKATKLQQCRSGVNDLGAAATPTPSDRAGLQPDARGLGTDRGMGGALALLSGSTAVLEMRCELVDNNVAGPGGGIAAIESSLMARQTLFKANQATSGGGGLYASSAKVMLVNGPRFHGNTAAAEASAEPEGGSGIGRGGGSRRLLQLTTPQAAEVPAAGGALHLAGDSRAVCEQCDFQDNSAPQGRDAYIGPAVSNKGVVLSTVDRRVQPAVYPQGRASINLGSCWPLLCALQADASTTTCGENILHKDQLTGGTSSVGFAESVAVTTHALVLSSEPATCSRKCLDDELLLLPISKCRALEELPDLERSLTQGPGNSPALTKPPGAGPSPSPSPIQGPGTGSGVDKSDEPGPEKNSLQTWILAASVAVVSLLCLLFVGFFLVQRRRAAKHDYFDDRRLTASSEDAILVKASELRPVTTSSSQDTAGGESGASPHGDSGYKDAKPNSNGVPVHLEQVQWEDGQPVDTAPDSGVSTASICNSVIGPRESLPKFPPELEVAWDQLLGSGAFGQVYVGHWTPRGPSGQLCPWDTRPVAVKVQTPSRNDKERLDKARSFQEEAGMMGRFKGCDRIVEMISAEVNDGVCWIVYELLPNGTLAERIHNQALPPLSLLAIVRNALDVAVGLEELHKVSVVHRDLKPDNLLLDHESRPKLIDFGISRERNNDKTSITTDCVGTWSYMAPEQFSNRVSEKVDVYALGITIWEMYTRQRPWKDLLQDCPWQLVIAVMNDNERLPIPSSCPGFLRSLIEECWLPDPRQRPTMHEVSVRLRGIQTRLEQGSHGRSSSTDSLPVLEDPQLVSLVNRLKGSPFRKGKALLRRIGTGPRIGSKDRLGCLRDEARPQLSAGPSQGKPSSLRAEDTNQSRRSQSASDLSPHMGDDVVMEAFGRIQAKGGSPLRGASSPGSPYGGSTPRPPPATWEPAALQALDGPTADIPRAV